MNPSFLFFFAVGILFLMEACEDPKNTQSVDNHAVIQKNEAERSDSALLAEGQTVAQTTFGVMSAALSKAMKAGGVAAAVQYCNVAATPIADSLSQVYKTHIRRVTAKPRNAQNLATAAEMEILETFRTEKEAVPRIVRNAEGNPVFYAPIKIQSLCLKCHGTVGNDLQTGDYQVIQQLYPDDQAIGYQLYDLRGMWAIEWKR